MDNGVIEESDTVYVGYAVKIEEGKGICVADS